MKTAIKLYMSFPKGERLYSINQRAEEHPVFLSQTTSKHKGAKGETYAQEHQLFRWE
jgi:hypothetical protein